MPATITTRMVSPRSHPAKSPRLPVTSVVAPTIPPLNNTVMPGLDPGISLRVRTAPDPRVKPGDDGWWSGSLLLRLRGQVRCQIVAGIAARRLCHLLRRAGGDDFAAFVAAFRPQV